MEKSIPEPVRIVDKQLNWAITNPNPYLIASGKAVGADMTKVKAALVDELQDRARTAKMGLEDQFKELLREAVQADFQDNMSHMFDVLARLGYNMIDEIQSTLDYVIKRARERAENGGNAWVDESLLDLHTLLSNGKPGKLKGSGKAVIEHKPQPVSTIRTMPTPAPEPRGFKAWLIRQLS